MTRRDLGKLAASTTLFQARAAAQTTYTGALDGFQS
jgi:hypothetical protein